MSTPIPFQIIFKSGRKTQNWVRFYPTWDAAIADAPVVLNAEYFGKAKLISVVPLNDAEQANLERGVNPQC